MGYPILYITGKDVLCSGKREKRKKGDKHGSERATHVKDGNARWGTAASSSLLTRSGAVHAAESFKRTRQTGTHRKAYILCSSLLIYTLQATSRIGWGLFSFAFCQLQTDTQTSRPTLLTDVDETHWSPSAVYCTTHGFSTMSCSFVFDFCLKRNFWANQSKVIGLLSY